MKPTLQIDKSLKELVNANIAWSYKIIPKSQKSDTVEVYMDEKSSHPSVIDELEVLLGKKIIPIPVEPELIQYTLNKEYRRAENNKEKDNSSVKIDSNSDILTQVINDAHALGSSDIHIEVYENRCRIRIRVDGKLIERHTFNQNEYPAFINKIKIKSNLDIAEKRLPQDGRLYFSDDNNTIDIRVSSLPTLYGEKMVLRLLNKETADIDIKKLGFDDEQYNIYTKNLQKPHGIILISGPTGSGKTTTLYATLKILNKNTVNISTIEDPIEYTLEGINQVQLKEEIGLTYANTLRTFLRQDPDIIMIGEIRDSDTAQMAIRAALTGHLILSTIHTNSAIGTISRLLDIGIPSYLIKSTLNMSIAQRLVRLLCPECKEKVKLDGNILPDPNKISGKKELYHYKPVGCNSCYFTGYKGRKAIYEIINLDKELTQTMDFDNIEESIHDSDINYTSLADKALSLFLEGLTSIEEIYPILITE